MLPFWKMGTRSGTPLVHFPRISFMNMNQRKTFVELSYWVGPLKPSNENTMEQLFCSNWGMME